MGELNRHVRWLSTLLIFFDRVICNVQKSIQYEHNMRLKLVPSCNGFNQLTRR